MIRWDIYSSTVLLKIVRLFFCLFLGWGGQNRRIKRLKILNAKYLGLFQQQQQKSLIPQKCLPLKGKAKADGVRILSLLCLLWRRIPFQYEFVISAVLDSRWRQEGRLLHGLPFPSWRKLPSFHSAVQERVTISSVHCTTTSALTMFLVGSHQLTVENVSGSKNVSSGLLKYLFCAVINQCNPLWHHDLSMTNRKTHERRKKTLSASLLTAVAQ